MKHRFSVIAAGVFIALPLFAQEPRHRGRFRGLNIANRWSCGNSCSAGVTYCSSIPLSFSRRHGLPWRIGS